MKTLTVHVVDEILIEVEEAIARRNIAQTRPRATQASLLREALTSLLSAERGEKIETRFTNKDA